MVSTICSLKKNVEIEFIGERGIGRPGMPGLNGTPGAKGQPGQRGANGLNGLKGQKGESGGLGRAGAGNYAMDVVSRIFCKPIKLLDQSELIISHVTRGPYRPVEMTVWPQMV